MSEQDALLAAICENPDEDTPRLVYADWLDEHDQPDYAQFVRAQVELARTPAWEPFAVLCKWRRTDWLTGNTFRATLPRVDGFHLEWHTQAFRRGFGWRLNVRTLNALEQLEPQLLACAPVGEMQLWGATLDDWRRFAASPLLRLLRRLHFTLSPIEALIVMRNNPDALGITDLFFNRASGAGMPEVIEDLLASPLGHAIRGLHFRTGYESLNILLEKLAEAAKLERLSFTTMGLTSDHINQLASTSALRHLRELHLLNESSLDHQGIRTLVSGLPAGFQDLTCSNMELKADGLEAFATAGQGINLRRLNLSQSVLSPRATKVLSAARSLSGLRSLILTRCRLGDKAVRHLIRAKFWRNLVELDLRGNPISTIGIRYLMDMAVPPDLTALILNEEQIGPAERGDLRKKYGERLVIAHALP